MYAFPIVWCAFVRKEGHPISLVWRRHAVMRRTNSHAMVGAWRRLLYLGRCSQGRRCLGRRWTSVWRHSMYVVWRTVTLVRGRNWSIMSGR